MSRTKLPRLFSSFVCPSCLHRSAPPAAFLPYRTLTTTPFRASPPPSSTDTTLAGLSRDLNTNRTTTSADSSPPPDQKGHNSQANPSDSAFSSFLDDSFTPSDRNSLLGPSAFSTLTQPAHRLHIYATKHNTHITFVQPPKPSPTTKNDVDVLLSVSAGNIGFRKAGRGSYDAGYQLGAFVLKQIQERGLMVGVQKLEVVLRGFGAGREAVTKALLGAEGRGLRGRITSVVDATRLKMGGPRSPKPRRLG
ncbi:hypothetical protein LTR28_006064 [Elasticomyces elasticus]|nr:hypothetical protein LTR28_006064 [Elasticomyces elasticus]